jgi:micrococcal nuclease
MVPVSREWTVPARVVQVHDGDTITVVCDLGWKINCQVSVRIAHINAPELATPEGKAADAFVLTFCKAGDEVTLTSHSLDKYGRTLGSITLTDGRDFGTIMLAAGAALPYEGGKR